MVRLVSQLEGNLIGTLPFVQVTLHYREIPCYLKTICFPQLGIRKTDLYIRIKETFYIYSVIL